MTKFLDSYSDFVGANNFFVVCDDRVLQSYNKESDYKKFFPVDSEDQLENDFKIWRL